MTWVFDVLDNTPFGLSGDMVFLVIVPIIVAFFAAIWIKWQKATIGSELAPATAAPRRGDRVVLPEKLADLTLDERIIVLRLEKEANDYQIKALKEKRRKKEIEEEVFQRLLSHYTREGEEIQKALDKAIRDQRVKELEEITPEEPLPDEPAPPIVGGAKITPGRRPTPRVGAPPPPPRPEAPTPSASPPARPGTPSPPPPPAAPSAPPTPSIGGRPGAPAPPRAPATPPPPPAAPSAPPTPSIGGRPTPPPSPSLKGSQPPPPMPGIAPPPSPKKPTPPAAPPPPAPTTAANKAEDEFAKSTSIAELRVQMLRELAKLKEFMSEEEK